MRNFDGTNDNIDFGSAANLDAFTTFTAAGWMQNNASLSGTAYLVLGKDRFATAWAIGNTGAPDDSLHFARAWSTANAEWWPTSFSASTTRFHFAVVYDGGSTANDPTIYINGASQSLTEVPSPAGTLNSDAAQALRMGENASNALDWNGRAGWICYDSTLWDAAAVNRARWWGRPHGGLVVYHPFVTSKLTNEGSGTATGTVAGTTVVAAPAPVVRPGSAMLGFGVGW